MPGIPLENIFELENRIRIAQRRIRRDYEVIRINPENLEIKEFYERQIRLTRERIKTYEACMEALKTGRSTWNN